MASVINTNFASLNTQNNLNRSQGALQTSIQRLSSGMRINSAKDDAAGFGISSRMESTIRGQQVAIRNANDGISFSQTAEGALGKISDNFQRMRELAVQAANGSNNDDDNTALSTEFKQLQSEIARVIGGTKFNDKAIFGTIDSSNVVTAGSDINFQVGAGTDSATDQITMTAIDLSDKTSAALDSGISLDTANGGDATAAITAIDDALKEVNTESVNQGAYQNRFASVISNLQTSNENQTAAQSRIRDTDYASETANLAKNQILQQAGMAMLAQANQLPNGVMALLR